jgi:catechol 2,3-dioxygenase-like lactoylglutathione lyase family enzyme
VSGVRFPYSGRYHDLYFVSDPTKPSGPLNATAFASHLHAVHRFDIQETWDWYQDWHLCLLVDDLDLVLARLLRDGVPVVSRSSYSFYVELPHGITLQLLGSRMTLAWSETFNFCRFTTLPPNAVHQPLALAPLPDKLPPLPELAPGHHSYFSTQPDAAQRAVLAYLGGEAYNMTHVWEESHRYSDGRCALLAWCQLPGYQLHFVQQYRKAEGSTKVADMEAYLEALHQMAVQDSFFDNRVAFAVASLDPFEAKLRREGQPFLKANSSIAESLFLRLPGGIIVELLERR